MNRISAPIAIAETQTRRLLTYSGSLSTVMKPIRYNNPIISAIEIKKGNRISMKLPSELWVSLPWLTKKSRSQKSPMKNLGFKASQP